MKRILVLLLLLVPASLVLATGAGESSSGEPTTLRVFVPGFSDMGSEEMEVIDYMEGRIANDTGVLMDIEMVSAPWGQQLQQLNLLLASEDVDLFNHPAGILRQGIHNEPGLLTVLDDLLPQYAPNVLATHESSLDLGRNAAGDLVLIAQPTAVETNNGYWIRMDLVEDYGLERPETLADLEEFWDAALADGRVPVAVDNTGWLFENLIAGAKYLGTGIENGQLIDYRATSEYEEWLVRMADYYDRGYFHQEIFTWSASQNDQAVVQAEVALSLDGWWMYDHYAGINGEIPSALNPAEGAEEQQWAYLGGLVDADGNGVARGNGNALDRIVGIPAFSDATVEALTLYDWLTASFDNNLIANRGIPGQHFELVDGKAVTLGEPTETPRYIGWIWQLDPNVFLQNIHLAIARTENRDWLMPFDRENFPVVTEYDRGFVYDTAALNDIFAGATDLNTFVMETQQAAILGEISARDAAQRIRDYISDLGQPYQDYLAEKARQLEAANWQPYRDWNNR